MSQTSEDRKKPFHEVVSSMLLTAPVGLTSDPASGKTEEVVVLLTILQRSKMPAAEAKKTAANHAHLPGLLESVGRRDLAKMAKETLEDLAHRSDGPAPSKR